VAKKKASRQDKKSANFTEKYGSGKKKIKDAGKPAATLTKIPAVSTATLTALADALRGTTANIYLTAPARFKIDTDDNPDLLFERLDKELKLFRCENCSTWTDRHPDDVYDTCGGCINERNDADL